MAFSPCCGAEGRVHGFVPCSSRGAKEPADGRCGSRSRCPWLARAGGREERPGTRRRCTGPFVTAANRPSDFGAVEAGEEGVRVGRFGADASSPGVRVFRYRAVSTVAPEVLT